MAVELVMIVIILWCSAMGMLIAGNIITFLVSPFVTPTMYGINLLVVI